MSLANQSPSLHFVGAAIFLQELPCCGDVSTELPWTVLPLPEGDAANLEEIRGRQRRKPVGPEASAPSYLWVS